MVPPLYCKGSHEISLSYCVCTCVQTRAKDYLWDYIPNLISLHLSGSAVTESTVNIKPNCISILSYCYLAMEVFVILEIKSKNEREWTWNYRLNDKKCLSQNASERTDILRELSISSRDKINSCLTSLNAFFHLVFSSSTFRYANFPQVPALQTSVSA